ncbi:MAG: 30S ribosomal protein S8 [Candidatus Cryosericum sp.]
MSRVDALSDFLTRVRNANLVYHDSAIAPYSEMNSALALILKKQGYVGGVSEIIRDNRKYLKLDLKYTKTRGRYITGLKRISLPGRRIYVKKDAVPRVLMGAGMAIISTPQGLMTDVQARKEGLGGEVICFVW